MSLKMESISKHFGQHVAVNNVNLDVPEQEIFGLLGPNGAGKTTLIRMILGLLQPTEGKISWNNKAINYSTSHLIGYLPEERGLYPKLTVKEQLVYLGRLRGMSKQQVLIEMEKWLERFRVPNNANKKIDELSKGNQQKIQFMAAVIHQPKLIFLDEPFSGLDPVNVELLKDVVLDLAQQGTTIIFSSHRMDHVEELCHHLCILQNGHPLIQGNLKEIKRSFGKSNVIIHTVDDLDSLSSVQGVIKVKKTAQGYHVQIQDEDASQRLLHHINGKAFISQFALEEPSLNDIFIEKVGATYE